MRKLLLFFAMLLMAVVVKAAPQTWSDGDGNSVEYDVTGNEVRIAVNNAGALAAFFNSQDANNVFGSTPTLLKIETKGDDGALNADDLAALNSSNHAGLAHFTRLDMEKTTLVEGSSVSVMSLSGAEYMALPHGTPIADMKTLGNNCTSLKAVAATNVDPNPTEFTGYSWAAGEIYNICQTGLIKGIQTGACTNTMQKLTIGGNVDDRDASTLAETSNITNVNSSFSSGAHASYYVNGESVSVTTDYIAPSHSGGGCSPWKGGTDIELDFTEALFGNYGDLALISANATELLLPADENFTRINNYMFANLPKLKHIVVPDNIVTIGDGAFFVNGGDCLTEEISIGSGVKTIGNAAFAAQGEVGRSKLTDIRFAPGVSDVKVLSSVFMGCKAIKHMMLPEGIVSLGERCFNMLLELESVHFPTTLEYIGRDCFRQTGLTMLTIPANVKVIDYNAFSLCRITDIYLMAENINQLPYIYAIAYDYTNAQGDGTSSTFDSNMLNGNNTTAPVRQKNDFLAKDSKGAEELFRLSVNGGNTITKLHYNENLKNFIDLNPWYFEDQTKPKPNSDALAGEGGNGGINESKYLSDTYYLKDNENKTYPAADAWDLSRPTWAAYYSAENHAWGADTDYPTEAGTQAAYYDPATGVLSAVTENTAYVYKVLRKEGWRQFTFKAGDAASEDITFHKQYDNVWYTMCFPFSLTDEQLESAFNAEYNIADFSGIEVIEENAKGNKEIVLHFNKIAKAKYYDLDHNEYQRVEGSKQQQMAPNGALFNTYTYTRDGASYTYVSTFSNKSYALNGNKDNGIVYIDGYLSQAGRPYMIHPNLGTSEGQPSTMTHMVGINYYSRDAEVIDQLCKDMARSVDLGTGKGYEGVTYSLEDASDIAVNTENEITENIQQAAYSKYPDQTYSFVGNCNEYSASAPKFPSVENGGLEPDPNIEDYVSAEYLPDGPVKAEQGPAPDQQEVIDAVGARLTAADEPQAPEVVANPADDTTTYPEAFQTFYNATGGYNGNYDDSNLIWGDAILNWQFSDLVDGPKNWGQMVYSWDHGKDAFKAYFGMQSLDSFPEGEYSDYEGRFNALKALCQSYHDALAAYQQYPSDLADYEANWAVWKANVDAWTAYDAAYAEWDSFDEAQAEADYQAALTEYGTQVGNYNTALQTVRSQNEAAVATWRANVQQYAVYIPENAYFLSRKSTEYYTHFFREKASLSTRKAKGTGKWSRYSAVLIPNDAALNGVEVAQDPAASKAFNMAFDEAFYAAEDATAIEQVVEEAKEKGMKVEYINVVVSIDGKVVRRDNTSLEGLPSGIYIVNGKKYFVK